MQLPDHDPKTQKMTIGHLFKSAMEGLHLDGHQTPGRNGIHGERGFIFKNPSQKDVPCESSRDLVV